MGSEPLSGHAPTVARRVAEELTTSGAEAVVLVGSHARGEAGADSDLDLLAVGDESYLPRLEVREGVLVSVSVQPFAVHRKSFGQPELVCTAVPGWRYALALYNPEGLAADLIRQARGWTWEPLERECDAWVAEEVTARAEEVHKLVAAREKGNRSAAAVQRSLLAIHLAPVLAVHHRILYGSDNHLWDLVAEAMGERWSRAQATALGINDESFGEGCVATLELYRLAADKVAHLLDGRQRAVVERALALVAQSASL